MVHKQNFHDWLSEVFARKLTLHHQFLEFICKQLVSIEEISPRDLARTNKFHENIRELMNWHKSSVFFFLKFLIVLCHNPNEFTKCISWFLVADAVSMPVHWYYNRGSLDQDYGDFATYCRPKNPHPDSILWRSEFRPKKFQSSTYWEIS